MTISIPTAELRGTIIDCLVYGLYLSIFARAVEALSQKETHSRANKYLSFTTFALFCLITAHLGLDIDRAFHAFTENTGTPHFADDYFNTLAGSETLAKNSVYVMTTMIADLFLIFRCFIVWGNSYLMIIVPSLLYIGNLVTACLALVTFKHAGDPSRGKAIISESISRFKYMYICTLVLNLWCTFSIAARVWLAQRRSTGIKVAGQRVFRNTIAIIIESAAIYSVFTIILIISASLQSALTYAVLNPMPSIIGIVFSLIIVRVSSGQSPRPAVGELSTVKFRGHSHDHASETTLGTVDTMVTGSILPTANVHLNEYDGSRSE